MSGTVTRDAMVYDYSRSQRGRVVVGSDHWTETLREFLQSRRAWIVVDEFLLPLVGDGLLDAVSRSAHSMTLPLPAGERTKSFDAWHGVVQWLTEHGARRRDVVVAFGGSTISDVVGFAAATYLRGIPYINIPTTLLAQVDGAVGGKVAINTMSAKNAIGAFHHPELVVVDVSLLATLPRAEISAGLAEAVKVSMAESSGELFGVIERDYCALLSGDVPAMEFVVQRGLSLKLELLESDPFEDDLQRFLNFGHTIGHALEAAMGYDGVRHGEAVAVGMACAVRLGVAMGLTEQATADRLQRVLRSLALPTSVPTDRIPQVIAALEGVRRVRDGLLNFVIPVDLGRYEIVPDVGNAGLAAAMKAVD